MTFPLSERATKKSDVICHGSSIKKPYQIARVLQAGHLLMDATYRIGRYVVVSMIPVGEVGATNFSVTLQ